MSLVDILLSMLIFGLTVWGLSLRKELNDLRREVHVRPPEQPPISSRDLKHLQQTMIELVQNVESYADSQLKKIDRRAMEIQSVSSEQDNKIQTLQERIDNVENRVILTEPTQQTQPSSTRVVPLTPHQSPVIHKNRDKILELYQKGWSYEKIAESLRITKGEVQLVVKLS